MTVNLSQYKIVVGTSNLNPRQDPVLGPNGTAMTTTYNTFVSAIEQLVRSTIPLNRGGIITSDANGNPVELPIGSSGFSLVSNPTTTTGLRWEPRVDLSTPQVIGGSKTFSANLTLNNGFLSRNDGHITADLMVDGTISGGHLRSNASLTVLGASDLGGTLAVGGAATLKNNLTVLGFSQLQSAILNGSLQVTQKAEIGGELLVAGPTQISNTLTVTETSNLKDVKTTSNVEVGGGLDVSNATNLRSNLNVAGHSTLSGNASISGQLVVAGSTQLQQLQVTGASVSGALVVGQDVSVQGNVSTNGALGVNGATTLAGSLIVSGATTVGHLTAQTLNLAGALTIPALTTSSLNVSGPSILQGSVEIQTSLVTPTLQVAQSAIVGGTLRAQSLSSLGGLNVSGPSSLDGTVYISGRLTTDSSAAIDGALDVGGAITSQGNITGIQIKGTSLEVGAAQLTTLNALGDSQFQGGLTVNQSLMANEIRTSEASISNGLTVGGDALIEGQLTLLSPITMPGLSGVNTGDEVPATPTKTGIVRVDRLETPHPTVYTKASVDELFLKAAELGITVAPLGPDGYVPLQNIHPRAQVKPFTVTSEGAMLLLNAQEGDIAIRTDVNKAYILGDGPPSNISSWVSMTFDIPASPVQKVFGRLGEVEAEVGDYNAIQVTYTNTSRPALVNVHLALGTALQEIVDHRTDVNNPHNVTPDQIGAIPQAELGVSVASLGQDGFVENVKPHCFELAFENANLTNGLLRVVHGLGKTPALPTIISNSQRAVIPGEVFYPNNGIDEVLIDLSSFQPLTGIWRVVVIV